MIDFTDAKRLNKGYGGANGSKISIRYDDARWMLKFPSVAIKNPNVSYSNSCVSEYIGSHVFQSVGIPTQDTLLGTYEKNGKKKLVVACRDFVEPGYTLQDFASLKNQSIDSDRKGYGTELSDILFTFEDQEAMDPDTLLRRFWDMFIVDALIGNWDRHNGNWGLLYNDRTDQLKLAPVFDCGSSLYPQVDEMMKKKILSNKEEINLRIFSRPTSAITIGGKRINYYNFISSLQNQDCNESLEYVMQNIDMKKINEIVDDTEELGDLDKHFYMTMMRQRKERILDYSLDKLARSRSVPVRMQERDQELKINSRNEDPLR